MPVIQWRFDAGRSARPGGPARKLPGTGNGPRHAARLHVSQDGSVDRRWHYLAASAQIAVAFTLRQNGSL
jgi:hypothetical protein